MDASSPLAAMHRPSALPAFGGKRDLFGANPHYARAGLRDQLPKRFQKYDYFSFNIRGSSPAASLCADISQNFRLDSDASPMFPTPRRALFAGALEKRDPISTSSLLSSPMPADDHMIDDSPLSKGSFARAVHSEIASPTPAHSARDEDEMMVDTPVPMSRQASVDPPKPGMADRRRPGARRPSLSRSKGFALSTAIGRSATDSAVPQLRLAADSKVSHKSSAMSLGECFEASSPPPQSTRSNGSPAQGHGRRPSTNPFLRTRKQVRRSLSMFEHPADVMKSKSEGGGDSSPGGTADVEDTQQAPALPHFFPDDPADQIPRISKATLLELLDGKYSQCYNQKMIIDCRFEYEYDGGHIDNAVNYNDKELLARHLFQNPMPGRTLLVFHCEYSAHRAPIMARHIRSEDRAANAELYPRLSYPDVYILQGGYSGFFAHHRERCSPQNYIEMSDERHQRTCERMMGKLKARKNFARAQTFAGFTQRACGTESPTAPSRLNPRMSPMIDPMSPIAMIGNSPILGERSHNRRMASY